MKKRGAQIITQLLERQGVRTISGIPGGANLPLYDALRDSSIRHILVRHEQGGGFIAQGMARVTGRAAVCLATSGPGATNLLTAIADAKLDSVPLVAITGQVPRAMIGTDAFQEVDTYGLTLPITKHNFLVRSAGELLEVIPLAFELAESGRPGPVAVDVPKDVQTQEIEFDAWPEPWGGPTPAPCDPNQIPLMGAMMREARRPVLCLGGGVIASNASDLAREFARKHSLPVVATLMGLGAFPSDDPLYLGMLGMHGAPYTNHVLEEADLLIAIGSRFDDRATGKATEFCKHARIIHVDVDRSEINKIKRVDLDIVCDAGEALRAALAGIEPVERSGWLRRVAELKNEHPFEAPESGDSLHPINLIRALGGMLEPDAIISTDVGQHQMWVAQAYPFRRPRTLLTSGGLGTMGFGLPAAIGAALAEPARRVVCISGDGSILMNIQELATLAELGLNVTTIIFNNNHLGLVRQQQELFYGRRYHASRFHALPDFAAIAKGFGVRGYDLGETDDPMEMLNEALSGQGPCVINAPIAHEENVLPMVPPGAANREMIEGRRKACLACAS
ncbi:MAG: biosynthetic-type acetolactate synthase large subunit [Candidatus Sumerlaeota bacterium]|nr:biosynthetic-type acetolactate synthase large subunit [Candidatus Sumerlaeota bacterium]